MSRGGNAPAPHLLPRGLTGIRVGVSRGFWPGAASLSDQFKGGGELFRMLRKLAPKVRALFGCRKVVESHSKHQL